MAKVIDDTLLPRPPEVLDMPAIATATRKAAERLEEQFNLSPDAAEALAVSVVDPASLRKAAQNPEQLYVPGGTLLGLRTRVWARRIMPDPRNPRVGPARRYPIGVTPGSTEDARFRPIPQMEPSPEGRPELNLSISSREHLSWASAIAKKYILKDNDWRLSIRNQGVMTEVWVSAVNLVHEDGSAPVTVPVTAEGSSRITACHDILDIRSADVPYSRDDRGLRSIIRSLNDAVVNGPTREQAEALRCETLPALLLVGFESHSDSTTSFATAARSLVALRHVDYPRPWNEAAKMEAIADAVIASLSADGLISDLEEQWLAGTLTGEEAANAGFSSDPAVRAARIVQLLVDPDPSIHQAIRVAITSQTTRQKIQNKYKLRVAAALIMRSVIVKSEGGRAPDVHKVLGVGFPDALATASWNASFRGTSDVLADALGELEAGEDLGPNSLELAARGAYALVTTRHLLGDLGTGRGQPDRRDPSLVVDQMRLSRRGLQQLAVAVEDARTGQVIRPVDDNGQPDVGEHGDAVTDSWLRSTFPPPGRPAAPTAPDTAHERLLAAISEFGEGVHSLTTAFDALSTINGQDGRPLISSEGVEPRHADAWVTDLIRIVQQLPVWKAANAALAGTTHPHDDAIDGEDSDDWTEGVDD
jgi:hypothetical protein